MLTRLGKVIVGLNIVLALGLMGVGVWTRDEALVASVARGKTYREVRVTGGQLSILLSSGWEDDQPIRFGLARPNELLRPSRMQGSGTRLVLLDQTEAFLFPSGRASGWPVQYAAGATFRHGHIRVAASSVKIVASPTTLKSRPTAAWGESMSNPSASKSGGPIPWPSLSLDRRADGRGVGADEGLALKESMSLSLQGGPRPRHRSEPPPFQTVTSSVSAAPPPMPRFERWTAPMGGVVVALLMPTCWACLAMVTRWRRRRNRERRGLCTACGYDLRGNPGGGVCPECGANTVLGADAVLASAS